MTKQWLKFMLSFRSSLAAEQTRDARC